MKIKLFYHWYQWPTEPFDSGKIHVSTHDMSEVTDRYTLLKVDDVEIPDCDIPDENTIRAGLVRTLQNQKKTILAETHQRVALIDEKISQLTCIENLETA